MSLVDASHTPDQLLPESRDSEAGSTKVPARAPSFFDGIVGLLRFIVAMPPLLIGLRRDHDTLTIAFGEDLRQNTELARQVREMARRLEYYEQNIPRMRELAEHYEQEKAGIRKPSSNGQKLIALS